VSEQAVRVLIIDDSALVRQAMQEVLESDPGIEVIAAARDPFAAATRLRSRQPDVIALGEQVPSIDGNAFLKELLATTPIPVVMCSDLTSRGSQTAMDGLAAGAVEMVERPSTVASKLLHESRLRICEAVKSAARARLGPRAPAAPGGIGASKTAATSAEWSRDCLEKHTADVILPPPLPKAVHGVTERIVLVGASTGGTEALRDFLERMPQDSPGVVIVQHMPEKLTEAFAQRLDQVSPMHVKEARTNDVITPGTALVAPGNRHAVVRRVGSRYHVELRDGPLVSRHRPSVDVLFRSGAACAGPNAVGVIMTGMGDDGAAGMLEMKQAGAYTIAQDERTCVVFGMPQVAIKKGGVDVVRPLSAIADTVLKAVRYTPRPAAAAAVARTSTSRPVPPRRTAV